MPYLADDFCGPCPPEKYSPSKEVIIKDPKTGEKKTVKCPVSFLPGEGITAQPWESHKLLDLTVPLGPGSGLIYGLDFQLTKWGYICSKVETSIAVSPVFTEYYNKTIMEKNKIGNQITQGFASLTQAIQDYELLAHDLRKYKEYMDRFQKVERIKLKIKDLEEPKNSGNKEEADKLKKELFDAQHILKAMFVDQVDAHTGDSVSLRGIAPRWPTVIGDFFDLHDEDDTTDKIMKRLDIPKAEGIILKTKNQLYVDWKKMFLETLIDRYARLKRMTLARRASIKDYRDDLRPLLSRYKAIKEMRASPEARKDLERLRFFRPDTQAISLDKKVLWAWRPFIVREEPFPASRESLNNIDLRTAGFNKEEIKFLKEKGIHEIPAMPAVPVMDKFIRGFLVRINDKYGVNFTVKNIVDKIKEINKKFQHPKPPTEVSEGPRWEFSPYYMFLHIPILRTVIKTPDGATLENLWFQGMYVRNETQNMIICRMLELDAINKQTENEIAALIGDIDPNTLKEVDRIVKEDYPEFYIEDEEEKKKAIEEKEKKAEKLKEKFQNLKEKKKQFQLGLEKLLLKLGIEHLTFVYPGPYEHLMYERMSKMMQRGPGVEFDIVDRYLKKGAGVPGV